MANKINLGIVIAENLAHQNLQSRTRCCGSYYFANGTRSTTVSGLESISDRWMAVLERPHRVAWQGGR
jgi:hypothetical protein